MFLITGTGRCGTGFAAKWLRSQGLDIGHERVERDGVAAWELTAGTQLYVQGDLPGFSAVLHVVREPLGCISSWQSASEKSWRFVCENSPCRLSDPLLLRCMKHWCCWNILAEAIADRTVRIESFNRATVGNFFGLDRAQPEPDLPADVNSRRHAYRHRTWEELDNTDATWAGRVRSLARRYGYEVR